MEVSTIKPGIATIKIGKKIESLEMAHLISEHEKLCRDKARIVLLDFSETETIRSSVAAVLVTFSAKLLEGGPQTAIVNPHKNVSEIFDLLGIGKLVPVFSSQDEALENLEKTPPSAGEIA